MKRKIVIVPLSLLGLYYVYLIVTIFLGSLISQVDELYQELGVTDTPSLTKLMFDLSNVILNPIAIIFGIVAGSLVAIVFGMFLSRMRYRYLLICYLLAVGIIAMVAIFLTVLGIYVPINELAGLVK